MFENIISYFEKLEHFPLQRMAFLVGGLLFFWIMEGAIPLQPLKYKKSKKSHAIVNMGFTLIHLLIHTFLAILIVLLSDWCKLHDFGFIYWFHAGTALIIFISFLTLDFFGGWLVHIVEHKVPLLWRFHIIHHADNQVDVTTGLRHHPIESVLRGLFFFMGIFVSGAPMFAVMIFQTVLVLATAFTHANIGLPKKLDKVLSYVFVSPNMHKVHHHFKQPYTDSNFGAVLAIWDRILGTFIILSPDEIRYGLDRYHHQENDASFVELLKSPFRKLKNT